jgi:hypothetical protein
MVVCVCALGTATVAHAATIAVPAGGDLQAALNAAVPGDVITLAPGAVYVGNFTLPAKAASELYITVRSAAPDAALPPDGVRITPAYASQLPKIYSATSVSSLRTKAGAHHWKLMFLEFQANLSGYGDIIALGAGDTTQTLISQVPHHITVDRVYVHGDPVMGQKRGISLNSSDTTIINSYISDIKAVGQDAQALGGYNGPGNYLIENNYLEAAGENFLLGGADPPILNLVTSNVTFRRNHLRKPLTWRDPIIATPANVGAAPAPGAGTLAAGTYAYRVAARIPAGQTTKASSAASAEVTATLTSTGGVTISWTPVAGAADYVIYGRTSGATTSYWKTTESFFTDNGAAGTAGSPPSATKWTVKNLFELKNAQDVVAEGNLFENCWVADQPGYPIVFTPRNQSGGAPWSVVQRVLFRNNLIRHTAGAVNILGTDNLNPSLLANHLTIVGNIWDDVGTQWGSGAKTFQIGDGGDAFTIDHNTINSTDSAVVAVYGGSATSPTTITNFVYTNNMSDHRTYGIWGASMSTGFSTINAYLPGSTIRRNVLAGGSASKYPADNFFPTVATWKAGFVNFDGGDYHLLVPNVYAGAGTDGADLGANVETVSSEAAKALSGDNRTAQPINSVRITTASLPNAVAYQSYAQSLSCSGGNAPCAWQLVTSALPAGLSFDAAAGVVLGTPTAVQTGNVTVTAFDPTSPANATTATLSVTVDAPPLTVTMPQPAEAQVGSPYQLSPSVTGAMGSVSWSVPSGSLPAGLTIDPASGQIGGVPIAWGTSTASVQAWDTWQAGRTDTRSATIVVSPAPISVATTTLGAATYGQYYQTLLNASGGSGAAVWSIVSGALPQGVTADAAGSISGTPTATGTFSVTVKVVDANWPGHFATAVLSLVVQATAFSISMPPPPAGQVGSAYQLAPSATGQIGTVSWSIASGGLPPGVTINAVTGLISGVPTAPGSYTATVRAQDSYDATRLAFANAVITIAPATLTITTASLPKGTVKKTYSAALAASGGSGQTTWSLASGALPAGLSLSAGGVISGTPAATGTASFTVTATDAVYPSNSAQQALSLSVVSGDIVLYALDASKIAGTWSLVNDKAAAGGRRMWNPDAGAAKLAAALAAPVNYFEITFQAEAGVAYHLWMRGQADKNSYNNDSVYVQFSEAVDAGGAAINRIGTTSAAALSIENGSGAGLSNWGWNDDAYEGLAAPFYFAASGPQTIRIQVREDGLSIDQVVISASTYLTTPPGAGRNDRTIVPK